MSEWEKNRDKSVSETIRYLSNEYPAEMAEVIGWYNAKIQRLQEFEKLIEWLESQAKASPTGISFDYCRHVEDGYVVEKGFRFMRKHFLGERAESLAKAIQLAQREKL